jgi:hypothetical protein
VNGAVKLPIPVCCSACVGTIGPLVVGVSDTGISE